MTDAEIIRRLSAALRQSDPEIQAGLVRSLSVDGAGQRAVEILGEQSRVLLLFPHLT